MVLAIIEVVVAVIVVAVPIVVDAVHDNHPLLLDPFPSMKRTDTPQRNRRPRPVARMARDVVVAAVTGRRCMVTWFRTEVSMPCNSRLLDMRGRRGMLRRTWLGCGSRNMRSPRLLWHAWPTGRPRELMSPRLLGRSCRTSVTAVVSAFRRSECRCAECRAGDSDECEFHEVVVHSTPYFLFMI